MTRARCELIDLNTTPYVYVISRCIKRSFLAGQDRITGKDYSHRRQWILDKISFLSTMFAIDIAAYAIMSNHYHLVLKVDKSRADSWPTEEVARRWMLVYKGHQIVDKFLKNQPLDPGEQLGFARCISLWRSRLYDISWFMKILNESVSRQANTEDNCKGHFWESRFKSQSLLDETAILSCMVYVDYSLLTKSPIRAGICDSLEDSEFTSIQERIQHLKSFKQQQNSAKILSSTEQNERVAPQPKRILPFNAKDFIAGIEFDFIDYLQLVEYTGQCIHPNKRGFIPEDNPSILKNLNINEAEWLSI